MRGFKPILGLVLFLSLFTQVAAQSLQLSLTDTTSFNGDTVAITLRTQQFDDIVSVQFSIQWDVSVIEYVSNQAGDLSNVAIGDFQAQNGELRFSWFDAEGDGNSLPDGSILRIFRFKVVGQAGDQTGISITDTPLAIQIFRATATPGIYEPVTLEQQAGSVQVGTPGAVAFNTQQVRCNGAANGSINLVLQGDALNYTFSWMGPDGFASQQANIANLAPGSYTLEVLDMMGELVLDTTIIITEPDALQLDLTETTESDCDDPSGSAIFSATGGTSPYLFRILGGNSNQIGVFEDLPQGNYTAIVSDANTCRDTLAFNIASSEAPQLDLPDTLSICGSEPLTLAAGMFEAYQWSTGATTDSIEVTQAGLYSVTVSNAIGCTASDTVRVISGGQLPVATFPLDYFQACPGDVVQLNVSGGETYEWIDTSGTLSALDIPNPVAAPRVSGEYLIVVSNNCGSDTASIRAIVYEVLATAGPDTCIAPRTEGRLEASGGSIYRWQESAFPVSNPTIPNPIVAPLESTTYYVEIKDVNGCVTLDSVWVMVSDDPAASIVAVNMLTPNGDGKNDVLEFQGANKFGQNTLKIYNRWGGLVYQKVNYQLDDERFDGTKNGEPLPAANYYYILSFRSGEIKQTLTIVRD